MHSRSSITRYRISSLPYRGQVSPIVVSIIDDREMAIREQQPAVPEIPRHRGLSHPVGPDLRDGQPGAAARGPGDPAPQSTSHPVGPDLWDGQPGAEACGPGGPAPQSTSRSVGPDLWDGQPGAAARGPGGPAPQGFVTSGGAGPPGRPAGSSSPRSPA
jgi:hypothetical protein